MNIWQWLRGVLKIRPAQLRVVAGGNAAGTANKFNNATAEALFAAEPQVVDSFVTALRIHPAELKGAPGIADHSAAADAINAVVESRVRDLLQ